MRQETGKQRAARIPLDYFKRSDPFVRWKRGLGLLALVLAGGWCAYDLLRGEQGQLAYSRGPVAAVHAAWDARCEACHEPFVPITGETWAAGYVKEYLGKAEAWKAGASAARCESCHAGPPHHEREQSAPACTSCHREHRGREASLVRLPDGDCTQCHADLTAHLRQGAAPARFEARVSRFAAGEHPQFKALADKSPAADPGRLKFNHKLHLTPGLTRAPGDKEFTFAQILDPAARKRYQLGGEKESDPVKLDCASCHRLDRAPDAGAQGRAGAAMSRLRAAGDYFPPSTYEEDCSACHPLTFDPDLPALRVPHHVQPPEVRGFLARAYTAEYVSRPEAAAALLEHPIPGPVEEREKARVFIAARIDVAEKILFAGKTTCGECHHYELEESEVVPKSIIPPAVPAIWFEHALFDHAAHRVLECEACHAGAAGSTASEEVLLPGIETCFECHAPAGAGDGAARGGARFDCTECHRYHNGDFPHQGLGARRRGVQELLDVKRFMSGAAQSGSAVPSGRP